MPKVTYQTSQGPKVINFSDTPTQADIEEVVKQQGWTPAAQAPSSTQKGPGAIGQAYNWLQKPAFDMGQSKSGIPGTLAKETANIAKSGAKFAVNVPKAIVGGVVDAAKIPGAAFGFAKDASAATKSQKGLDEQTQHLVDKIKEMRAQGKDTSRLEQALKIVAPGEFDNYNWATTLGGSAASAAYRSLTPEFIQKGVDTGKKEGVLSGVSSGVQSLAEDPFQVAPYLLGAKEGSPLADTKLAKSVSKGIETTAATPEVLAKAARDASIKVAEKTSELAKKAGYEGVGLPEKPIEAKIKNLDETIKTGIDKGVKPSVVGKGTLAKRAGFYEKSANAVKNIADMKDQIKITDPATGEAVQGPPTSVAQAAQATDQGLKLIWKKTDAIMKAAGEKGAEFDPTATVTKLRDMSRNLGNTPEMRAAAKGMINEIKELRGQSPDVIAERMAKYNEKLKNYYKSGVGGDSVQVLASMMDEMRKSMESSIEEVLKGSKNQELRNQYGEMAALDKEMQHRATVVGRQAPKSLFGGITDAGAIAELARGLFTMNPADLASSIAIKGLGEYIKKLNSPDANIAKMFKEVYDVKDAATEKGIQSLRDYKAPTKGTRPPTKPKTTPIKETPSIPTASDLPKKAVSVADSMVESLANDDYVGKNWAIEIANQLKEKGITDKKVVDDVQRYVIGALDEMGVKVDKVKKPPTKKK